MYLLLQVLDVNIALSLVSQFHDCFLSVSFLPEGQGFVSEDEYLEISDIKRDQSGEYECSALNDVAAPDVRKVKITVNCELNHGQGVPGGTGEYGPSFAGSGNAVFQQENFLWLLCPITASTAICPGVFLWLSQLLANGENCSLWIGLKLGRRSWGKYNIFKQVPFLKLMVI